MRLQALKRVFAKSNNSVLRKQKKQKGNDLALSLLDSGRNYSDYQITPSKSVAPSGPLTFGEACRDNDNSDDDSSVASELSSLPSTASFDVAFTGSDLTQLTIEDVLKKLNLTQYTQALVEDMGFEVAEDLSGVTIQQLKTEIGMKFAHANKLVSAIASALNGN